MEDSATAYMGTDPYIFVSYSHDDEAEVVREIRWLREQGFRLWWDEGIGAGSHWRDEIADRINQCSLFLLYVSPNSAESVVCREELEYALTHNRPILSVHLAETSLPEGISLAISNRQALFRFSLDATDYERKLLAAIAPRMDADVPTPKSGLRRGYRVPTRGIVQLLGGLALLALGVVATLWIVSEEAPRPEPTGRFHVQMPYVFAGSMGPAINGAGTHLFVLGSRGHPEKQIYVRALSELEFEPVQGTNLGSDLIGFVPDHAGANLALLMKDGEVKRIATEGGKPVAVVSTGSNVFQSHASWIDEDSLLVGDKGSIVELSVDGSRQPRTLVAQGARHGHMLPDRSALLYSRPQEPRGSLDKIVIQSLTDGRSKVLLDGFDPRITAAGHLLFFANDAVWAAHISPDGFDVLSEPVRVLEKVTGGLRAKYEVADTGTMVFHPKFEEQMELLWVSREGLEARVPVPSRHIWSISLSPDGRQVASSGKNPHLWTYSFDSGISTRVGQPRELGQTTGALWLPDGDRIVYTAYTFFTASLNVVDVNSGREIQIDTTGRAIRATSASADSSLLLIEDCASYGAKCDIGVLRLDAPDDRQLILNSEFNENDPQLSPDGRFLAYSSDEFGPRRIVVRPFPDVTGRYWQVPIDGCTRSEWSEAGDELFLRCAGGRYVVAVTPGSEFGFDNPRLLYRQGGGYFGAQYSSSRKQFLTIKQANANTTFIVVTNWFDELDRLIAAGQRH